MEIRRATQEDIPQIETLLYQVHKVHSDGRPDLFVPGQKKYTAEELKQLLADDNRPFYVAILEEHIVGYVFCVFQQAQSHSMQPVKTLYIDDLCVLENQRGKNIGQHLYQYALQVAEESACYSVTLNVWACNESARRFYDKCGLEIQKYGMEKILKS